MGGGEEEDVLVGGGGAEDIASQLKIKLYLVNSSQIDAIYPPLQKNRIYSWRAGSMYTMADSTPAVSVFKFRIAGHGSCFLPGRSCRSKNEQAT